MPDLSVVIVAGDRRERAAKSLESVLSQDVIDRMEVILVDASQRGTPPLPGSDHPSVKVVPAPHGISFGSGRADAVRMASSPIVAFLEEHAFAMPGWARALLHAYASGPWAAVGAEVHTANPEVPGSQAISLMNYHPWLAPATSREITYLPGHNSSFRRDVLLSYGDALPELLRTESVLFEQMHRDGHRMYLQADAKFAHMNNGGFQSIGRGLFLWHRCYGPTRAKYFQWSLGRRILYVVAAPLMPLYFMVKTSWTLLRGRRDLLLPLWRLAPSVMLAVGACAAGQAAGLLLGIGRAEAKFSVFEANEPRPWHNHT